MSKAAENESVVPGTGALAALGERGVKTAGFERGRRGREMILGVGEMIRRMRLERGWSQSVLAERARMTQSDVSRLESGLSKQGPSLETLNRVTAAMD